MARDRWEVAVHAGDLSVPHIQPRATSNASSLALRVGVVGSRTAVATTGDHSMPKLPMAVKSAGESVGLSAESGAEISWSQFRGPGGQGQSLQRGLPLRWSEQTNVAWKTRIPGEGWSSPVIRNNQIWLTTALKGGKGLHAICVARDTGKIVHDVEVFSLADPGLLHSKNGHASPTPILFDDRVIVHFGGHGTAALSMQGKVEWTTRYHSYHHHGPACSPIVADGILFLSFDGSKGPFWDQQQRPEATIPQFVVGLDPASGREKWKQARDGCHSYSTALVIDVGGKRQIISPGGNRVTAYDPKTGKEIWWVKYSGYSVVPRPVYRNGLVYVCTGYNIAEILAIRPTGKGDVTGSHVAWHSARGAPLTSSPVLVGNDLYFVTDGGVAKCLDAETGKVHWQSRLGGNFSASPIAADGRIYFANESGQTTVIEQGTKFKRLATNHLDGRMLASPAVAGQAIYLRSDKFLYRIEGQQEQK